MRTTIPPNTARVLAHPLADKVDDLDEFSDPEFWVLVRALKRFVSRRSLVVDSRQLSLSGCDSDAVSPSCLVVEERQLPLSGSTSPLVDLRQLPLSGGIPDMKAHTDTYIALQTLYHTKASRDHQEFRAMALEEKSCSSRMDVDISQQVTRRFCKYARVLRVIEYAPLHGTLAASAEHGQLELKTGGTLGPSADHGQDRPDLPGPDADANDYWHVMMRIADQFRCAHGRAAGSHAEAFEADQVVLRTYIQALLNRHTEAYAPFVAEMYCS